MRKEENRFQDYIRHTGGRVTETRRLVLEAIYETHDHFSGDDIFILLKQKGHDISRASIFRTLPLLVDAGLLRESVSNERHKHYEHTWGHAHHEHLVCSECHQVVEFFDAGLENVLQEIADRHGYSISDHKIEIYGMCPQCRSARQE